MTIESAVYISDLNSANPGASDLKSEGDDHIRLLKSTVKATFPNVTGAVTPTHTVINNLALGTFPAVAITGPTRITATTGLVPGNSAQAGNVLDWYEETALNLTMTGASGTPTTTPATGAFTRIGNRVFLDLLLNGSNFGTAAGQLRITGLPYAAAADTVIQIGYGEGSTSSVNCLGSIASGSTTMLFIKLNGAAFQVSDAVVSFIANVNGYYRV